MTELITIDQQVTDLGFQSQDVVQEISGRLIQHTRGKIVGGYVERGDQLVPGGAWDTGDLTVPDARYAVEYALTRGLNPYGHLHIWYQRSSNKPPQLIVDMDWKVLKGWAEWRNPFKTEPLPITGDHRATYGLKDGDIGCLMYIILDSDSRDFYDMIKTFVVNGTQANEARLVAAQVCAKGIGVGIVRKNEMTKKNGDPLPAPKGRSWQWRAEIRALRDAIRKSHGEPPPAQIRQYAVGELGSAAVTSETVGLLASEEFPIGHNQQVQERFMQIAGPAPEKVGNAISGLTQKQRVDSLRGPEWWDDTPLGEEPDGVIESSAV